MRTPTHDAFIREYADAIAAGIIPMSAEDKRYARMLRNPKGYRFSIHDYRDIYGDCALCYYCKDSLAEVLDHIVPVAKGGADTQSNLLPACVECNESKGTKSFEEFTGYHVPYKTKQWLASLQVLANEEGWMR